MARKFEYTQQRFAWNPEKCEEEIIIAAYDEIVSFIPADQKWNAEFENHFCDHGNGLTVETCDAINAVRRRRGLGIIVMRETDVYDYARFADKLLKSNQRRRIRDELKAASLDVRQQRIEHAMAEERRLPPPHMTYDEYKARRQLQQRCTLSYEEITKRKLALQAASTAQRLTKTLTPERAAKMLSLASSNIWDDIIRKLSAEDALEVAEKITDTQLRDALVRYSLNAL
jgi:hypothetical protein